MKYFVILLVFAGLFIPVFAMHDPSDPNPHPTMTPSVSSQDQFIEPDSNETNSTCGDSINPMYGCGETITIKIDSPLKQFKSGILLDKIQCKEGLVLAKLHDNRPACIKSSSLSELNYRKVIDCMWNCTIPIPTRHIHEDKIPNSSNYTDSVNLGPTDTDIIQGQTIILNKGIDDYDSETSFNPIYKKIILEKNNVITWFNAKQEPVHIQSDEQLFDEIIQPQESFSFAFDSVGIHRYHDPTNWKRGAIFASTKDIESSNLHPAKLLEKNQDDIARTIMYSAFNDDVITKVRLNNTMINAYTTKRGADIIVPDSLCITCTLSEYHPIEYRYGLTMSSFHPQGADEALDFAKRFMNEIGYKTDGTEWIDSVDYGSYIQVKIQQKVQGWIIPNQFVSFVFFKDNANFSFGRWYGGITNYQFKIGQDDAESTAKEFMQKEVQTNSELTKFQYKIQEIGQAQVIIFDDKPVYVIPVSFKSPLEQQFENSHCGYPEYFTQLVMIEGVTGAVLGLDQPGCE